MPTLTSDLRTSKGFFFLLYNTSKIAPKKSFAKVAYAKLVKPYPSISIAKGKKNAPPKKIIIPLRGKLSNIKTNQLWV